MATGAPLMLMALPSEAWPLRCGGEVCKSGYHSDIALWSWPQQSNVGNKNNSVALYEPVSAKRKKLKIHRKLTENPESFIIVLL